MIPPLLLLLFPLSSLFHEKSQIEWPLLPLLLRSPRQQKRRRRQIPLSWLLLLPPLLSLLSLWAD